MLTPASGPASSFLHPPTDSREEKGRWHLYAGCPTTVPQLIN